MYKTSRDCLRKNIGSSFLSYYNNGVFSAASLAVSASSDFLFENWYASIGTFGENDQFEVNEKSLFDLASLTKPLVTLPSVLHLIDSGKISWYDSLSSLLEREISGPFKNIELHNLLAHNTGLAAHEDYWKELKTIERNDKKDWLIREILDGKPVCEKKSCHIYSDLGYLLLGVIVEIKTGKKLNDYWRTFIAEPLELNDQLLFPGDSGERTSQEYIPTGVCRWSGRTLAGVVHDDNSRALGGITGHAGLFGSSAGVLAICREFFLLYHGKQSLLPFSSDTLKKACLRVNGSEWTCGFNLPSMSGSSSGRFFSPNSLGHLGFTGVSFWIDVDNQLIVCLLTNRVIKGESREGIQAMRPHIHDTVVTCLRHEPPKLSVNPGG